jgi:uncharacterized membrane protein
MKLTHKIGLVVLVVIAIVSRFYNLTYQSLWFDELYVMNVANPENTLQDIMVYMQSEFHPPFHFFLSYFTFNIFGYNDLVGRSISAVLGIIGIIAIYFLGLEIRDRRLGFIMAVLTTVNSYHIYHSQEIRMYITLFCVSTLSVLFFLRTLKSNKTQPFVIYVLFTALMLYTHYYGVFIVIAQGIYFLTLLYEKQTRATAKRVFWALLISSILFLPYIPFILSTANREHWIGIPPIWFFFVYLYDYVGKDPFSATVYIVGIYMFFTLIIKNKTRDSSHIILLYIFVSVYILSYAITLFKPIMQLRCTFVALPFLIAMVSIGIDKFKPKIANALVVLLVLSSALNILFISKYYTKRAKENFREITEIILTEKPNGVYFSHYAEFYNYYFKQNMSHNVVVNPILMNPDSILNNCDSFIILNAHDNVNIMTKPHDYRHLIEYINTRYTVDTIYFSPYRKGENAVVYKKTE